MTNNNIVKIEKLIFGGQGMGTLPDGRKVFVWGALPQETIAINITKNKKDYVEGIVEKIISPSPHRIPAKEAHFLSCSPWQVLEFDEENKWKIALAEETYKKIGKFTPPPLIIESDENIYEYRNKIEYNFWEENNELKFAFHERGKKYRCAITDCQLASSAINQTAHLILDWLNKELGDKRAVKSLIVRSNKAGQTIAALFIKEKLDFQTWPNLNSSFVGFNVYFSDYRCPASRPDELLFSLGQNFLIEEIRDIKLKYGTLSFFQVNIPIFEKALENIAKQITKKTNVADFYSGVGSISLSLHEKFTEIALIESNEEAVNYANENILMNKLPKAKATLVPAEKALDLISHDKLIILDPPRAGLHPDVIDKLLQEKPTSIVYLSCDIATHARDLNLLQEKYNISFLKLYNFFPRTPHIESLAILDLK